MINAVYDYAKQIDDHGLVIMDTPGNDFSSVAGMVAGGCQVVVFTTGRGNVMGNPIVPVFKLTGNKITYANMEDNMDLMQVRSSIEKTIEELGEELLHKTIEVANGKKTKSEELGYMEIAIARVCNYV